MGAEGRELRGRGSRNTNTRLKHQKYLFTGYLKSVELTCTYLTHFKLMFPFDTPWNMFPLGTLARNGKLLIQHYIIEMSEFNVYNKCTDLYQKQPPEVFYIKRCS